MPSLGKLLLVFVCLFVPGVCYAISENEAFAVALADIRAMRNREDQINTRYIWNTTGDFDATRTTSLALNYDSRGTVIVPAMPIGKWLVRVDIRHYAPQEEDRIEWAKTWEELRFDPRFNLLLTKDTLKFSLGLDIKKKTVTKTRRIKKTVPSYLADDGFRYDYVFVDETFSDIIIDGDFQGDVLRVVGEHIDQRILAELIDLTQSQAPVVSDLYFKSRALRTIKGKVEVYKTIYGGLYYEFNGIKKGFKKGTDFDNFLDKLGIGNVEAGITAEKVFEKRRSDQRVAKFMSNVANKMPRGIDVFRQLEGRIGDTQGIVSVTHDIGTESVDIGSNAMMNLRKGAVKDKAREVIWEKTNGLHGFALFDGNGALQDEVPPDVAADDTIPPGYGTRLEPAIGCIRCHLKENGWRTAENDVKKLTSGLLDIYGDLGAKKQSVPDLVDELAGLYAGDLESKLFPRGRDDYASAILKATGPWKGQNLINMVKTSGDKLKAEFAAYNYTEMSAASALADFDIPLKEGADAAKELRKWLPPPQVVIDGIIPEDVRTGALLIGMKTNRFDYDLSYAFRAARVAKVKALKGEPKK